jgi:hypothetical protein
MVLIQFFKEEKQKREMLLNFLVDEFPEITSLQYVINSKANDTIYDQEVICFKGEDHMWLGIVQESKKPSQVVTNISFKEDGNTITELKVYEAPIKRIVDESNSKQIV